MSQHRRVSNSRRSSSRGAAKKTPRKSGSQASLASGLLSGLGLSSRSAAKKTPRKSGSQASLASKVLGGWRDKASVPPYREKALKYYGSRCQLCGATFDASTLEVHHKDRNRQNADISNLQVLCPTCHAKVHAQLRQRRSWRQRFLS